jgi:hypothetical protein
MAYYHEKKNDTIFMPSIQPFFGLFDLSVIKLYFFGSFCKFIPRFISKGLLYQNVQVFLTGG